jgi:hypothetical protein
MLFDRETHYPCAAEPLTLYVSESSGWAHVSATDANVDPSNAAGHDSRVSAILAGNRSEPKRVAPTLCEARGC